MEINIQSIRFDADEKLLTYIQKKLEKLGTFYDNIIDAQVYLKLEKATDKDNKLLEIKLNVANNSLYTENRCRTFECAMDLAFETLRMQLAKYKSKLRTATS